MKINKKLKYILIIGFLIVVAIPTFISAATIGYQAYDIYTQRRLFENELQAGNNIKRLFDKESTFNILQVGQNPADACLYTLSSNGSDYDDLSAKTHSTTKAEIKGRLFEAIKNPNCSIVKVIYFAGNHASSLLQLTLNLEVDKSGTIINQPTITNSF